MLHNVRLTHNICPMQYYGDVLLGLKAIMQVKYSLDYIDLAHALKIQMTMSMTTGKILVKFARENNWPSNQHRHVKDKKKQTIPACRCYVQVFKTTDVTLKQPILRCSATHYTCALAT